MTKLLNLSKIDLPREKLEKYGPKKLKDEELLAILLGSGIKGKNVLELSRSIIKLINLVGIDNVTLEEVKKVKGMGLVRATQIIAVIELTNRFANSKPEILSDKDIWNLCSDIRSSKKEYFIAFFLDTQSRLIERQIISIGTLDSSLIHPRELFEPAIKLHSSSIIIAHNHPSGYLEPSDSDRKITKLLMESGKMLDIPIQKHLIISANSYIEV